MLEIPGNLGKNAVSRSRPTLLEYNVIRNGIFILAACLAYASAHAQTINLDPPGDRDFILDRAGMIRPQDAESIRAICDQLLSDQVIPIIVVTIESMARYGGQGMSIETFAYELFNQWEIGYESVNGVAWNRGILLLISRDDRKARIELGATWGRDADKYCQQIMDEQIIPNFKDGRFSQGILAGVVALDKLSRNEPLPEAARSSSSSGGGGFLSGLMGVLLYPFILIIGLLKMLFGGGRGRSGGFSGGSFSGGSFGGGFSGGGGATGSW